MKNESYKKNVTTAGVVVFLTSFFLIFPLLALIPYNRLSVDDYCAGRDVKEFGFIGAQIDSYKSWSGRFSSNIVTTLVASLSTNTGIGAYTLFVFVIMFASFLLYLKRVEKIPLFTSFVSALFITGLLFALTPNKGQSWLWLSGSATYTLPLALTIYMYVIIHEKRASRITCVFLVLLVIWASGSNETLAFLLVTAFFIGNIACLKLFRVSRQQKILVLVGFITAVVSALVVYASPGNAIRAAHFTRFGPYVSFVRAFSTGPSLALEIIKDNIVSILFSTVLLAVFTYRYKKSDVLNGFSNIVLAFATLVVFSVGYAFVGEYSLGTIQPDRAHVIMAFLIVLFVVITAKTLSGLLVKLDSRIDNALLLWSSAFMLFLGVGIYSELYRDIVSGINYSRHFDTFVKEIRVSNTLGGNLL